VSQAGAVFGNSFVQGMVGGAGDAGDAGGGKIHLEASGGGGGGGNPGDHFAAATSGGGGSVPFKGQMESAFGQDFSGVSSHTGQAGPMKALGANAAARGDTVAFADTSPSRGRWPTSSPTSSSPARAAAG